MFTRRIDDQITVQLAVPYFAESLFRLVDENRTYLRRWLPWLDANTEVEHTRRFLLHQLEGFAKGESLCALIHFESELVGVAGFHAINPVNQSGAIGYWLAENCMGRGIMTRVIKDLIDVGRQYYSLRRIEIRCATDNRPSRAIPERLGFTHEGTLARSEKVYDAWFDMEIYGLLLENDSPKR